MDRFKAIESFVMVAKAREETTRGNIVH